VRKGIVCFTIFCMLVSTVAFAQIKTADVDSQTRIINISGTVADSNKKVSIIITKPDVTFDDLSESNLKENTIMFYETTSDENGNYGILFRMPQGSVSGEYNVWIMGQSESRSFYYADIDELNEALTAMKSADAATIEAVIKKYAIDKNVFYLDTGDEYSSYMTDEQINSFFAEALVDSLAQYSDLTTENVSECFDIAMELTRYSYGDYEKILEAINNNYLDLTFDSELKAEEIAKIFINIREVTSNQTALQTEIRTSEAIVKVNKVTKGIMTDVLTEYNDIFNLDLDGDYAKVDKIQVNKFLCDKNFENVEEIRSAFNKAVTHVKKSEKDTGNSGGSSSSGGHRVVVELSEPKNNVTDSNDINNPNDSGSSNDSNVFIDLNDVQWAVEYINTLYSQKVISGMDGSHFAPNDNVTREQFLKMIVLAFKVNPTFNGSKFKDVEDNSWYAPYVSWGYENGIINGISDERFGVGESITREDASVMLVRMLEKMNIMLPGGEVLFGDSEKISDYAKQAVGKLCGNEIIIGMPDGTFEPKSFLSRAQAAKIICLSMKVGGIQ